MWFVLLVLASAIPFAMFIRSRSKAVGPLSPFDHVLLVIAHPDDESLFFSPTMLKLAQYRVPTSVLCLSNGNADGKGAIRAREFLEACSVLSIPRSQITIIDDPLLQDGMERKWDTEHAAGYVREAVDRCDATAVLTFDAKGVSGHPNHIATFRAVTSSLSALKGKRSRAIRAYSLESVSMMRKFISLLDLPLASLLSLVSKGKKDIILSPYPSQGWAAMRKHKSQMVWYRYLFLLFSSYTVFNVLVRLDEEELIESTDIATSATYPITNLFLGWR
jgi:N-acetylglucosaminylphosphatidylinositol deacetylase